MKANRGFALIESMVALAIILITLPVLFTLLVNHKKTLSEAVQLINRTEAASAILEQVRADLLEDGQVASGSSYGSDWEIVIDAIPLPEEETQWALVEITVRDKQPRGRAPIHLSTLHLVRRQ